MDLKTKTRLYHDVSEVVKLHGRSQVEKALEEFEELIEQLELAIESMVITGTIQNLDEIVDEIADVIVTAEQITGEYQMLPMVENRVQFKLDRLQKRYITGKGLFK